MNISHKSSPARDMGQEKERTRRERERQNCADRAPHDALPKNQVTKKIRLIKEMIRTNLLGSLTEHNVVGVDEDHLLLHHGNLSGRVSLQQLVDVRHPKKQKIE